MDSGRGKGAEERRNGGQRVQIPSFKMNKFWGYNVLYSDYSYRHCIVHLRVPKTADLKSSYHKKIVTRSGNGCVN